MAGGGSKPGDNDGDELRFMRFMSFCGKCAGARAQFESPRYAAIAVANQGEKVPDIYMHMFREGVEVSRPIEAGNQPELHGVIGDTEHRAASAPAATITVT
jgi:hypothetical protein